MNFLCKLFIFAAPLLVCQSASAGKRMVPVVRDPSYKSTAGTAAEPDTVVRQFSMGTATTTVGIAPAGSDVELTGPQALTSDTQGNLFVLDQINGRILQFDPKQPTSDPSILNELQEGLPNDAQ